MEEESVTVRRLGWGGSGRGRAADPAQAFCHVHSVVSAWVSSVAEVCGVVLQGSRRLRRVPWAARGVSVLGGRDKAPQTV